MQSDSAMTVRATCVVAVLVATIPALPVTGQSTPGPSGCGTFAPDVLYGAGDRPRSGPPANVKKIVALSPDENELKKSFNKDQGRVRLVLILSPT